jgi:hypothetical protein
MGNNKKTDRWHKIDSYNIDWRERALKLMKLFLDNEYTKGVLYSVNEFGCGKFSPFHSIMQGRDYFKVKKFDIKAWDEETHIINFNSPSFIIPKADISVFSGVLEYLNDVPMVISKSMEQSNFLLISYASSRILDERKYISEINYRAVVNGFRNHYSNKEIIDIISHIGILSAVGSWKNQSLFLLRNFEID